GGGRLDGRGARVEVDDFRARDAFVASGVAGEDDDLAVLAGEREDLAHRAEAVRVGVAEGVVDDEWDALAGVDEHRGCDAGEDGELFPGPTGELVEGHLDAVERARLDGEPGGERDGEGVVVEAAAE